MIRIREEEFEPLVMIVTMPCAVEHKFYVFRILRFHDPDQVQMPAGVEALGSGRYRDCDRGTGTQKPEGTPCRARSSPQL
jgi:hypothetical protein